MKFTEDQQIWIIEAYAGSKSPTTVRRDFLIKYGINGRKKNEYTRKDFARVFFAFQREWIGAEKARFREEDSKSPSKGSD